MNAERQVVLLEGGPLNGEQRSVHSQTSEFVEEWDAGPAEHWPPPARRTEIATYRRVDATRFRWCATETTVNDRLRRFFVDPASNLHPYECNGPGFCLHCDRAVSFDHDPDDCALCAGNGDIW